MAEQSERQLPVSFSAFVVSLASSAMVHLGDTEHPGTGAASPNLELARNTIDVLGILQDKTKGNLDEGEAKLLDSILGDLRMRFVRKTESS